MLILDERLKPFATERQWEYLEAIVKHGTASAAARALGVDPSTVRQARDTVRRRAAQQGYAPKHDLTHEVPDGLRLKGTSIRYDGDGNVEQYWNKTALAGMEPDERVQLPDPKKVVKVSTLFDQQGNVTQQWVSEKPEDVAREKLWREFADSLAQPLPRIDPTAAPEFAEDDLCLALPVGDHHLGMLAWSRETGENYNLKIGEELLVGAVSYLVNAAPPCSQVLIPFLGDLAHFDTFKPVTPEHGNLLDADSRFPKLVEALDRMIRRVVEIALSRHGRAHLIFEIGNHDPATSVFLMIMMRAYYEREPRVTVDTSPMHYHYFRWGKTLIGTHHGHGAKMDKLPLIMAADRPQDWGETDYRYWWTGHIHHDSQKDYTGCSVESFRVLPPEDAYAHQKGYRSGRDMNAIILHREFGETSRNTVNPAMFERAA